ncbi:MAG: hypothetical protein KF729_32985, partial [Sandaracinaceae bacterium]|nr:hypothetical protein [Sandaracinaceae bacterium]
MTMRAAWRRVGVVLVALAALAAPSRAAAQLVLGWDVPDGCPPASAVHAEVARLLGGQLPDDVALEAGAVASSRRGRWRLRLTTLMAGVAGERVIEGDACAPLADAAALVLALMIDPLAVAAHAEPAPGEPTPPGEPGEPGEAHVPREPTPSGPTPSEPAPRPA